MGIRMNRTAYIDLGSGIIHTVWLQYPGIDLNKTYCGIDSQLANEVAEIPKNAPRCKRCKRAEIGWHKPNEK